MFKTRPCRPLPYDPRSLDWPSRVLPLKHGEGRPSASSAMLITYELPTQDSPQVPTGTCAQSATQRLSPTIPSPCPRSPWPGDGRHQPEFPLEDRSRAQTRGVRKCAPRSTTRRGLQPLRGGTIPSALGLEDRTVRCLDSAGKRVSKRRIQAEGAAQRGPGPKELSYRLWTAVGD